MTDYTKVGLSGTGSQTDRVLLCFKEVGRDVDLPIAMLWERAKDDTSCDTPARAQQQNVGGIVSRINRKLKGERIVPGVTKRTYRLVELKG